MKESHKSVCEQVFNRIGGGGILPGTGIEKYMYTVEKVTVFRIFGIIVEICHFAS